MPDGASAVELRCGRLRLVIGGEVGVTAAEIIETRDLTRLDVADLPGTRRLIDGVDGFSEFEDALLIVANEADPPWDELHGDVEIHGHGGATVGAEIHNLGARNRKGIVAEAALAAWRQRLSDAADRLEPLTHADAEILGRLAIPGSPLITELRAERRRAAIALTPAACLSDVPQTVVDGVLTELRAAVRFGAAGLTDTPNSHLLESIELACGKDGWVTRLSLLLAAEEVAAVELLSASSGEILGAGSVNAGPDLLDQILLRYWAERRHSEELSSMLDDVVRRLPTDPKNPATRLLRRRAIDNVRKLRRAVTAYSSITHSQAPTAAMPASWVATTISLLELEAPSPRNSADPDGESDHESTYSVDEAAALLGALFAKQLPAARALVEGIKSQHPDVGAEEHVQNAKRNAVDKLTAAARKDDIYQSIPEVVAELAMAIALLRGLEPHTEADFKELGSRLLARADRIAKLQYQAGKAVPMADVGFNLAAQLLQRLIAEYAFHRLGDVKPSRTGAARDAYKTVRSKTWRARRDPNIAAAAAGGAAEALQRAIDAGAPRLVVRYVDRSLRGPKK